MKIALLSPKGPLYRHRGGIFKKNLRYAPLTLTTLASLVPEELDAEITIVDEGIQDIDLEMDVDLVGMTVITGSARRAYELADHFRGRGIPVVLGGPHITLISDDAAPHADSLVIGYAEDTWPELLRDFHAGKMKPRYIQSPDLSLANRPFPRRDMLPRKSYITTHVFEATRGCVHSCDFCVVPTAWGKKPYLKPVEDIVADIRQHWARKIIFIDLNLIADPEYAAQLFEALIPLKVEWFGLSTTLLGRDEQLLALAAKSGCTGLLMGFESITPENLKQSRKGFNSPDEYRQLVEQLHGYGITLMACFTFGMDYDTPDIFMETAKFAVQAHIDLPRFAIVTPFPNTGLYHRLESEGRIISKDWELYDAQHVVFQPRQMTVGQLYDGHERAWKYTYSWGSMARRFLGSRIQIPVWWVANFGYRFYAHHLHTFYNCDWVIGQVDPRPAVHNAAEVSP
ncbi:MAG: B12-binding domain-containing radical SAM protein [Anaerolineae bacterium]|nr:MAG: B12-binding domain-containing radical SAM protein [Anaerolineae bacterium]